MVTELIKYGADPTTQTENGQTALSGAASMVFHLSLLCKTTSRLTLLCREISS